MQLFYEWSALTQTYRGWTLEDIKNMSKRERTNWLEVAKIRSGRSLNGEQ
jgi:hypothetical protein